MSTFLKILLLILLFGALGCIRMFENELFYDPLLLFFKSEHIGKELPDFHTFKLLLNVSFRYVLNTVLSLLILWVAFRKIGIIKVSALLYLIAFVLLIGVFWLLLGVSEKGQYMALFYVRRFLIQPLFLLLLLPAFYFKK